MIDRSSLRELATGFGLAEGPVVDPVDDSSVLVTDVILGGIHRVRLDGGRQPWGLDDRRGAGGLAVHEDGGLVVTGRSLIHVTASGEHIELVSRPADITGYNDLGATPEGGILVGALRIKPALGQVETPGDLIHIAPDGSSAVWSAAQMVWPNGVRFTRDGRQVLVADFATGTVFRSSWEPGRPAQLQPWVITPSGAADGMSMDEEGNAWVALGPGGGVAVYGPDGTLLTVLDIPAEFVSSVCHAGPDARTLVVTTMHDGTTQEPNGGVFAVDVEVPGAVVPNVAVGCSQ